MRILYWYERLSRAQRVWLFATALVMVLIVGSGALLEGNEQPENAETFSVHMSIRDIAPRLGATGKALARELGLPLDTPKGKPLKHLGVTPTELQHTVEHLRSHQDRMLKYYVYAALCLGGLVFLWRLGRPDGATAQERDATWYPRAPYVILLLLSVCVAGFALGKSPNPMEGIVKVFKAMAGLYPDPGAKVLAFVFFIALAVIGNKVICGWACPFGALQELVYSIPWLRRMKKRKLPFAVTNTIRGSLFAVVVLVLFGVIGGRKGMVLYHFVNPFNLFDLRFETVSILLTAVCVLVLSLGVYRPFCQLICPFGFVSWLAERFSLVRVRIDPKACTKCGACIKACPLDAAKGRVEGRRLPADCFSCARCLNVCPVDAIRYTSILGTKGQDTTENEDTT